MPGFARFRPERRDNLNAKQETALRLLLQGYSQTEIAKEMGVDSRTVRRWQEGREFQAAYNEEVQELLRAATDEARRSLCPAIAALRQIAQDDSQSAASRVAACRAILDFGLKMSKGLEEQEEKDNRWIFLE
jgi:transcriptional regulator with XRE-family HTH domain